MEEKFIYVRKFFRNEGTALAESQFLTINFSLLISPVRSKKPLLLVASLRLTRRWTMRAFVYRVSSSLFMVVITIAT